jgi:hypothetical protein
MGKCTVKVIELLCINEMFHNDVSEQCDWNSSLYVIK